MELKFDVDRFDRCQKALVYEIALQTRVKLTEAGLSGAELEDCVAKITYSIANILDDMAAIESDGEEIRPYLTFRGEDDEVLIHCGENACTNDFVYETLNKLFK